MQELISKSEATKLVRDNAHIFKDSNQMIALEWLINSLPTTVHHEYKVGNLKLIEAEEAIKLLVEYSDKLPQWLLEIKNHSYHHTQEHPDITQARELASKHWMILIPKE